MDVEEKAGSGVAEAPAVPDKASEAGGLLEQRDDDVHHQQEPYAVVDDDAPEDLKETSIENIMYRGIGDDDAVNDAEAEHRNGDNDVSAAHLGAAPGYSPSFASLGDTATFESLHAPTNSDTFEGFDAPRISHSQEFQETPKVTRPEALSFTTPTAALPVFGNTLVKKSGEVPSEAPVAAEDISPIANLVETHAVRATPVSTSGIIGGQGVDATRTFSFNREGTPQVITRKIPGHELLGSFMSMHKAMPRTDETVEGANPPGSTSTLSQETPAMPESGVHVSKDKESTEREPTEASQGDELKTANLPMEMPGLETDFSEARQPSPLTTEEPLEETEPRPASEGVNEDVAIKAAGGEPASGAKEEVVSSVPQADMGKQPESFAFQQAEPLKEVSMRSVGVESKQVPHGKFSTAVNKKLRGPSDIELKKMVMIPEYLAKDMVNAVETQGTAYPEGPPVGAVNEAPTCPLLVFINSKSGGRLGPELKTHFIELISPNQVYDLSETKPSDVMRYGVGCLDRMANSGDDCARQTRANLRILVAGGDGTVGWVLSSVGELQNISPGSVPPCGVVPLGTGNDLSRSFGWGGEFSSTNKSSLKRCLVKAMNAKAAPLDTWQVIVMPAKSVAATDIQFPHAMHPQHHVPLPTMVAGEKHDKDEKSPAFDGLFFNYFSIGMDAQVAYGFHHLRDEKPWLARGRLANQVIYSSFGCTQGWFCTACSMAPRARGVGNIVKIFVKRRGSSLKDWEEIHIPSNIRAIVVLNLQNYAGGRNPWGKPSSNTREREGFVEQSCDDGVLEIMGLRDGWHSAFVLLSVRTAVRLCQAEAVRLELNGNVRKKAYLQMDGEPWMQPLGTSLEDPTVLLIEKLPTPSMLLKR